MWHRCLGDTNTGRADAVEAAEAVLGLGLVLTHVLVLRLVLGLVLRLVLGLGLVLTHVLVLRLALQGINRPRWRAGACRH